MCYQPYVPKVIYIVLPKCYYHHVQMLQKLKKSVALDNCCNT
jgi:hypothetical protein